MTPTELVADLRDFADRAGNRMLPVNPALILRAADLIERAYPPPGGVSVTDQELIDRLHSICQPGKWVSWKRDAEIVDLAVARIRRDSLSGPSPIPQPPPGHVAMIRNLEEVIRYLKTSTENNMIGASRVGCSIRCSAEVPAKVEDAPRA